MCKEMEKLRRFLEEKNIKWEDCSDDHIGIERTRFKIFDTTISVVHGLGTIGGLDCKNGDKGLLEVMTWKEEITNHSEPEGDLTADEVVRRYVV